MELAVIFIGAPLTFRLERFHLSPLPALWTAMLYCLYRLWSDPTFDRRLLWNIGSLRAQIAPILVTFAATAALLGATIYVIQPDLLFNLVRRAPLFWVVVVVLYPVFSVYPQGIIFRSYFLHRFRSLFPGQPWMILTNAAAFAFMHTIFHNSVAVIFSFAGGVLFAWRYCRTRSLFISSVEHALYGCWIFTVGLGQYFDNGGAASL